jgi:hypothetical protein
VAIDDRRLGLAEKPVRPVERVLRSLVEGLVDAGKLAREEEGEAESGERRESANKNEDLGLRVVLAWA